ncbi:hypothetical protein F4680DRAFT_450327 [Xylaria scruposa]|nr:hypothetical protein F4680DRAFT_450327 [Xylaria scruposa]
MASSLETLPAELVDMVAKFLDFQDVTSLRCTSRTMESKTLHAFHSTGCFDHKNIKLEMETLEKFAKLSSNKSLTSRLQHCTIIGITGLRETMHEWDEYIRLLTAIFRNLEKNIQTGSIVSLSFRVILRITNSSIYHWERFWNTAVRTFGVTIMALIESNLSVEGNLDLFSSVPFCSLEYTAFLLLAQETRLAKNFKHLKRLTMSLSPFRDIRVPYELGHTDTKLLQGGYVASTLRAISQLPAIMPELESLDFHWFYVGATVERGAQSPAHRDVSSFSTALTLKECTLRGIYVSESDLLEFITSTSPMTLRLMDVNLLTPGTYESIFQHITHANSQTIYCHFEYLWCTPQSYVHAVYFDKPEPEEGDRWNTYLRYTFSPQMKKLGHQGIPHQVRETCDWYRRDSESWIYQKFPEYGPPVSQEIAFSLENGQPIDAELLDVWIDGRPGNYHYGVVTYTTRANRDDFPIEGEDEDEDDYMGESELAPM